MRGKPAKRRTIEPDERYHNDLVARLINYIMLDGKKSVSRDLVYNAIEILGSKVKKEKPIEAFEVSIENLKPKLEIRSRRVGGANYTVPVPVPDYRQVALAMRWLIAAARGRRKSNDFEYALADELFDAYNKTGTAYKKKEDTHRMAEANKAFAHFQW